MRKQKKQLLIIICILLLCVGGYIWAKNMPKEEEVAVGTQSHTVTSINQDEVIEISYFYEGEIIELVKEDEVFKSKEDKSLSLDQAVVSDMLSNVCSITTDMVIESPETLAEYGLTNPANTICLTLSDGSIVQLLIGDYLDITGEYYILLTGDAKVYTVSGYIPASFQKSIDDLIEETEETTEITTESMDE